MRILGAGLVLGALLLAAPARADIVIATTGPVTGQDAATGEQQQRGAEAAVAGINARGGVMGQKLRLLIKDDACDPKQAVAVANQLGSEKIAGVIGSMCSGAAIPASKIYNEEGIVMISPAATNPEFTDQKLDNIFRVCGRDDQQGQIAGEYILKNFKGKNIALVHDKTAYGRGLADEVRRALNKAGVQEKVYESISRGERDYSAIVSRLKQAGIDVLFIGGYPTETGLIARQLKEQGAKVQIIGGDALMTNELWAITGSAGEGVLMSFSPDPRRMPEAADAIKRIRAAGYEPEGYTMYSYASVQVLAQAMEAARSTDGRKVAEAIHKGAFKTVIGSLTFDDKGDVKAPGYIMYRWSKGGYAPVENP